MGGAWGSRDFALQQRTHHRTECEMPPDSLNEVDLLVEWGQLPALNGNVCAVN